MGYTHYWNNIRFSKPEWRKLTIAVKNVLKVANDQKIDIVREYDNDSEPALVNNDIIIFNGRGDEGHETFALPRDGDLKGFEFCKTAHKPYDAVVVAILILAQFYNTDFEWSSDGDGGADSFDEGFKLLKTAGYGVAAENYVTCWNEKQNEKESA